MDNSDKNPLVTEMEPPPYTEQPTHTVQPGYQPQPGYSAPQPGYPAQPGYQPQPRGYSAQPQPGYPAQPQPGYPAQPQPGYPAQPQPGYPAQYGYPPPQQPGYAPQTMQQQSTTMVNVGMPAAPTLILAMNAPPPSWLCLSIFTFLCCPAWPIGLAALIFSCMVDSSYGAGDYQGALRNSNIAKWLNVASIICGIIVGSIFVVVIISNSNRNYY